MRNQIIRHVTSSVAITETTPLQRWRNIISKRSELNELYLSLAYSQDQINKLHEFIDQCLSLVDFEIPDLPAFLSAVSSFLTSGKPQPHDSVDFGLIESLKKVRDVPTIRKILGNKLAQIAPMNRNLHFRFCLGLPEQIADLLEIRILDRVLLERTLNKLKNEIEYGPQSELVKQEALKSIDNVSHRISQPTEKDDPRAKLEKMAEAVEEATVWICHEDIEINGRRDRLNEVIVACESFREDFHPKMDVNTVGFAGGREGVQRAAKLYLDSKWMHHPSVTGYVTSTLLDTDLAPLLYPRFSDKVFGMFSEDPKLCRAIYTISEELDSGCYDVPTLIKRLQEWEIKGYYVHSLGYPLLRLHACDV